MEKDHDCDIDRQAQCGKRDSKNSGSTYQRGRIHERERVHGDMDLRQHAFAGHAEGLRDGPPGTRGLPDKSRPLQTDGKTHQDRYGMDTGHQRSPPAESDRESIRRLREHYCGHRRLPGGRNGVQVPLPVFGMQETLPSSMELVTYGRSRAGGNGQPQARQPV